MESGGRVGGVEGDAYARWVFADVSMRCLRVLGSKGLAFSRRGDRGSLRAETL